MGRLWAIPYVEHTPEELPTADARLVSSLEWKGGNTRVDARAFGQAEMRLQAERGQKRSAVVTCFPQHYALPEPKSLRGRCVPESEVPMVRRRGCGFAAELQGSECVVHANYVSCPPGKAKGRR